MNLSLKTTLGKTALAAALSLSLADTASATWVGGDNVLGAGETITNLDANSSKDGWIGSQALSGGAWGMFGSWVSFQLTDTATTTITAAADPLLNTPAFTLYKTDISWIPFGLEKNVTYKGWVIPGQTESGKSDITSGSLHDFSQVAQAGQYGLVWATNNTPGGPGVIETLGYANSGNALESNHWGQAVNYGPNDVSIDDLYESGITGIVGAGFASLKLSNLAAGWYTIFVSGANTNLTGAPINVTVSSVLAGVPIDVPVSSVPVPGAAWLFGSALVGLAGASRKRAAV